MQIGVDSSLLVVISRLRTRDLSFRRSPKSKRHCDCIDRCDVCCFTPGRWGNPPSRGRKIKHVYIQSYNPGVLGWGFLRFLLRLQLRSLSRGVPSSHLEKDERSILRHVCIYSWKRHALCYAVLGYARNHWLNTLYGIVWETKYGRFTTLNIPNVNILYSLCVLCGFWWFLPWDGWEM